MSFLVGIIFIAIIVVFIFIAMAVSILVRIKNAVLGFFTGGRRRADARGGRNARGTDDQDDAQSHPARPVKKIDPTVGEYVDFEEVRVYDDPDAVDRKQVKFEAEEQVSDAEWEEVK